MVNGIVDVFFCCVGTVVTLVAEGDAYARDHHVDEVHRLSHIM